MVKGRRLMGLPAAETSHRTVPIPQFGLDLRKEGVLQGHQGATSRATSRVQSPTMG